MTFTPATWILATVPMFGIILLSVIYYVRFELRNKHNRAAKTKKRK